MYDVIIVGGSFAGLSAAMQIVRARKRVLLIDAGSPRNRFAAASHGFLGLDGVSPAAIRARGLEQLAAYPTFELREGMAESVRGEATVNAPASPRTLSAMSSRSSNVG